MEEIVITRGEPTEIRPQGFGKGNNLAVLKRGIKYKRAALTNKALDITAKKWEKFITQKFEEAFERGEINLTKEFFKLCILPSTDEDKGQVEGGNVLADLLQNLEEIKNAETDRVSTCLQDVVLFE